MTPVLIIIDLLQDFFREGLLYDHKNKIVKSTNQLVDFTRAHNIPVIWVRQEYKPDLTDASIYNRVNNKPVTIQNTQGCLLLPELHFEKNDFEIIKKRYSAFFKTQLDDILSKLNVDTLIIAGINTMTCVRTTAIDAYQRDYNVILASDCVDAYDKEQHDNSIKYLQYAVAKGLDNEEIFELLKQQKV
jgi:nicotinamidase-related amidase